MPFFEIYVFFKFLAALSLCCCVGAFLVVVSSGCYFFFFFFLGATLCLQCVVFSFQWLCSSWNLPGSRTEPGSPALAGGFLTTGSPGKFPS